MIGADEYCIHTKHGTVVSVSRNEALRDFALQWLRDKGFTVDGSFVDSDKESIRREVWMAWAHFKS